VNDLLVLETARGPVTLRPERAGDADFLYGLFRSHALPELAPLAIDEAGLETLVRMQFRAQTEGYRSQFPHAQFDIVERDGAPIGRLIVHDDNDDACIVDFALIPACRSGGIGTAILSSVLTRLGERPRPVRCTVMFNNEPSLRMCRRVGFIPTGGDVPFIQMEWRRPEQ
jgi:RimJ/RimL family protein N-acetyltransferase